MFGQLLGYHCITALNLKFLVTISSSHFELKNKISQKYFFLVHFHIHIVLTIFGNLDFVTCSGLTKRQMVWWKKIMLYMVEQISLIIDNCTLWLATYWQYPCSHFLMQYCNIIIQYSKIYSKIYKSFIHHNYTLYFFHLSRFWLFR